jgi:FAD/FMN-containing dehydrogenase
MEGYSLALDFKIENRLFPFLDELDQIVLDYGGRLYLTKDVRMPKQVFQKGYPGWEAFAELREKMGMKKKFNSLQSRRLGV